MSTTTSRVFKNISANWLALLINIVISFFLAPFVVNHLGAEMYGIWAVAMQFTGYIYLMDFGVRDSLIRYTAKYRASGNALALRRILSVAILIYLPVFLAALLAAAGIAYGLSKWANIEGELVNAARITVFLVGASIASTFLFNIYTGLLQGLQRFDVTNSIYVVIGLLRATTIVIVLKAGGGVVEMAWIQFGFTVLAGIACYFAANIFMKQAGLSLRPARVTGRKLRALLRLVSGYSVYVFINNIGQKLAFATDALVISLFMPIAAVTFYAIAGNLISYLHALVSATATVFTPVASQYAARKDKEGLRMLMLRSTRLNLMIGLPIACTYVMLGDIFIGLWMGDQFVEQASMVLLILGLTQILSFPHYSIASILYGIGRHRTLAFLRMGEGIINLVLSMILVQSMGLMGVALGTAIPHTVIFGVILPIHACSLLGISWWKYITSSLVGPLLNAIPFMLAAWFVHEEVVPTNLVSFFSIVAVLCFLYVITGYRLCLNGEERGMVRARLQRYLPVRQAR
ncbi:MAG: oligosaccharide flippase family protein [Gammaproteobacteria bacterium]|nr:oligosaccharide flippase family protein [Gammaproteobacteria bacterium]